MSYCRFLEGDVYAYECKGGVQFYVAGGRKELDRLCSTFSEAYQYAKELRDTHGLDVPSHAIEALKADALEEAARICGPDGAVEELKAENAELRDELDCCLRLAPNCDGCEAMLDCDECLRADSSQKERKRLDYENGQLRELVRIMHSELVSCEDNGYVCGGHKFDECVRELGVEV